MNQVDLNRLREIVMTEFADIVRDVQIPHVNDLRITLSDGSFIKIWFSLKISGRYSYHWERRMVDGTLYRHDNARDDQWRSVVTWPKHFHFGRQENVIESYISDDPETGLRAFMQFARATLQTHD